MSGLARFGTCDFLQSLKLLLFVHDSLELDLVIHKQVGLLFMHPWNLMKHICLYVALEIHTFTGTFDIPMPQLCFGEQYSLLCQDSD